MRSNVVPLHAPVPPPRTLRARSAVRALGSRLPRDARMLQIVFLGALLTFGVIARDFTLQPLQMVLAFGAGLVTQAVWIARLRLRNVGYLSAFITCFGLSILLRADSIWVHPLAACLAISAKFTLRAGGKHVWNPANFGVIVAASVLPGAWVSPGQWGNALAAAAWFVALGGLVSARARRADMAWTFLALWLGAVGLRVAWLGQSWSVWWHQLGSGGLLLFAFFMISDPMTIPSHRRARVVYASIVVALAFAWQFLLFRPNALVVALFVASPLVPLLDRVWPAGRFDWHAAPRETLAPGR
jgi:Na+-transporting NADH:ubiquinone oxidoreductase subunit NqrB